MLLVTLTALQLHLTPLRVHGEECQVQRARQCDRQPASRHSVTLRITLRCCSIVKYSFDFVKRRNGSSQNDDLDFLVTFEKRSLTTTQLDF